MCTLTWWQASDRSAYEIFFNRDEKRSRGSDLPPHAARSRGTDYLAPGDAKFGGTWLLVNIHGISLALLNCYPEDPAQPEAPRSRGKLLRDLADVPSVAAVAIRLNREDLSCYGAFFLIALGRNETPRLWIWDTHHLQERAVADDMPVLTSSIHLTEEVERHRTELFAREWSARGRLSPAQLEQFHLHQDSIRPAYGILMDRPDSHTSSFCRLKVGPGFEAIFAYYSRRSAIGALPELAVTTRLVLSGNTSAG